MTAPPSFRDGDDVARALQWPSLIAAIEDAFRNPEAVSPERTVHSMRVPGQADATMLLKPGWIVGDVIVVKIVNSFPDNGQRALPTINAGVLVFDGTTGQLRGACDGNELTARRTAAASAVARKLLARRDATRLLVVGTGALAPMVGAAHHAVAPLDQIDIWGRDEAKAARVAEHCRRDGLPARSVADLDAAVPDADIISCVTGATSPLLRGELLRPGTHLDLIGSFSADMRESDDACVTRSAVFVDTFEGALLSGDLAQPIADGVIGRDDIVADLASLLGGRHPGRTDDEEITLFKSAGTALEDVAAARLVFSDNKDHDRDT